MPIIKELILNKWILTQSPGSIIDEHGGSDAEVKMRQSKNSISTNEEYLELKTTVCQPTPKSEFQYKCQDTSTVWGGNLDNYESHHPEDISVQ
ncbi:unnamed protein product [Schistosoma mattheei]|uniref:Uncharacterized protein n=1 Tax=Schistosoma mattheei TaxID=31246 RepID=A0A183PNM2_9TREM|nr:unnamed protein product [Schistosoma mattheei]